VPELAERYSRVTRKAEGLHDGGMLSQVVIDVLRRLPSGPVWMVSTSLEGTSIAAACSALAHDKRIRWDRITLTRPLKAPRGSSVVVIEPSDPGEGWRQMVTRQFPRAKVMIVGPAEQAAT
jgi:hypothetical protein